MSDEKYTLPERGSNTPVRGDSGRRALRDWLSTQGVPFDSVKNLTVSQLNDAYHDTTDAIVSDLKVGGKIVSAVDSLSDDEQALIDALRSRKGAGVDEVARETAKDAKRLADEVHDDLVKLANQLGEAKPAKGGVDSGKLESSLKKVDEAVAKVAEVDASVVKLTEIVTGKVIAKVDEFVAKVEGLDTAKIERVLKVLEGSGPAWKPSRVPVAVAAASGNPIADALAAHYTAGNEVRRPLLVTSPPSFGKSHAIGALGRSYDTYLVHGCSNNPDEFEALVGGPVAAGEDGFLVVDGKLTQAVRAASEGGNVLLVLDEVLRWPEKVQESFLTFLQPIPNRKGERVYSLTTRHRKGGAFEVLEAPVEKLHVVAAANLTSKVPVEAFWSRFDKSRHDFSVELAEVVSTSILTENGVTVDVAKLAKNYAGVVAKSRSLCVAGVFQFPADFRLLEGAVQQSDRTPKDVAKKVSEKLWGCVATWDADLSDTNKESKAEADKLAKAFYALF